MLTPDHPAPVAAAHRQAGYPHSLAGTTASDHHPSAVGVVIWLAAYRGAAPFIATPARSGRAAAASPGPATGLLFDGDVSAKLSGYSRPWLAARTTLIAAGVARTSLLQSACQPGDVLTASDTATIMTNAVPITAGFVPFGKRLPHGIRAGLQLAARGRPWPRRQLAISPPVGVLLGVAFLPGMVTDWLIAAVRASWRWADALMGVLFAVAAIWSFANPINAFRALASVPGLLLIFGNARQHQPDRDQGRQ